MVYIKLSQALYQTLKPLLKNDQIICCQKQNYLAYPHFKSVTQKHKLQLHKQIGRNDIITNSQLEQLQQQERQSPEQKRLVAELKNKREMRILNKMKGNQASSDYYFQNDPDRKGVKEITQSISFSMAFVFTFFMAGVTGYYFGTYFLGWGLAHSLMVALGFIIVTIVVQTTLFILKQTKNQPKIKAKKYRDQYDKEAEPGRGKTKNKTD